MTARKIIKVLVLLAAAPGLTGCSSLLVKSTPAPLYFQLRYPPVTVACAEGFRQGVAVWPFDTSSPYNRPDMVAVENERQVKFSSDYQWVASPGTLLSQSLLRDLNAGTIFTEAVGPDSPIVPALELTGHIFTFAWEKEASQYRAVLKTEVSLLDTRRKRRVVLRKEYRIESSAFETNDPQNFAVGMSAAVSEFSKRLQEDFCRAAKTSS